MTKNDVYKKLIEIKQSCGQDDWDGEGAPAIVEEALAVARAFVAVLPDNLPLPSAGPGPDGDMVDLYWNNHPRCLLVALKSNWTYSYFGYIPKNEDPSTTVKKDNVSFPKESITQDILNFLSD